MKVSKAIAYALHALMYMVRHSTQLPVTTGTIAKAEGLPAAYLSKIFQKLVKGGLVRSVRGRNKGYVFAKPPEKISLLDLFEIIEKDSLFDECLLKHCDCKGTPKNCNIYASWLEATANIKILFKEITLEKAAWNHPEHRFSDKLSFPELSKTGPKKKRTKQS